MSHEQTCDAGARIVSKVAWRFVPFLGLLYFFAFLDRVNVGFAALTMNEDIGLSAAAYGLGAGMFFVGYVLFEVPSNIILQRVGARIWIARIMISWGLLSASMAFVTGPTSFYILRFLLGVAEAGFFPGIIYYLSCWFPAAWRARILGAFLVALPMASVLGAPLSTMLLGFEGLALSGWQWMFILEGLPAAALGFIVLRWLTNRPAEAEWLQPAEREWLEGELAKDQPAMESHGAMGALRKGRVWLFGLAYFGIVVGIYTFSFWLPQMVKSLGDLSNIEVGLVLMILSALAAVAMVLWGRHSDRSGERRWHVALPALLAGVALVFSGQLLQELPLVALVALTIGSVGIHSVLPPFWTLSTALLSGPAAAAGIALINSMGNIGGFVGPVLIGYLRETTGSHATGLSAIAVALAMSCLVVLSATCGFDTRAMKSSIP